MPDAAPAADAANLQPLGIAGEAAHLWLAPPGADGGQAPTSVALFDQGLTQMLEASVTGLAPKRTYTLALAAKSDGSGPLEPLATFTTNPAGAAIVNAIGSIRQLVRNTDERERRFLVITSASGLAPVQVERP